MAKKQNYDWYVWKVLAGRPRRPAEGIGVGTAITYIPIFEDWVCKMCGKHNNYGVEICSCFTNHFDDKLRERKKKKFIVGEGGTFSLLAEILNIKRNDMNNRDMED